MDFATLTGSQAEQEHPMPQFLRSALSAPPVTVDGNRHGGIDDTVVAARRSASWDFSRPSAFGGDQPNGLRTLLPVAAAPRPSSIQRKLAIGRTDDPLEHEADRVADQVMRMPNPSLLVATAPLQISRKCAECEEEDERKKQLQMKPAAASPAQPGELEHEADRVADQVMRTPDPEPSMAAAPMRLSRKGADCAGEEAQLPRANKAGTPGASTGEAAAQQEAVAPAVVHETLASPGQPLDAAARAFFEPRFGYGFSHVRLHTDDRAAASAAAINSHAYTLGSHIAFAAGQHEPSTFSGRRLLAHELAHVVQSGKINTFQPQLIAGSNDVAERQPVRTAYETTGAPIASSISRVSASHRATLQRTPASQVSCGAGPLTLPNGTVIDDPVGTITTAESTAGSLLDNAIAELSFTIDQIRNQNQPIGFPTISDALALGLQIVGLDPNSDRVWKQDGGVGNYTATLLLRRLRLIRNTIGKGSFFFICLGPQVGTIGSCSGPIFQGAFSSSCAGSFQIDLCPPFWSSDAATQAATIIHESAHNFAEFIQDIGREGNAECYVRFANIVGGTNVAGDIPELCPDPT